MTGKDLIIYILANNIENEDVSYIFNNLLIADEAYAEKIGTGVATVRAMFDLGHLRGIDVCNSIYIYNDVKDGVNNAQKA